MPRCDGDPTRSKLLALSTAFLVTLVLLSDSADAADDDIYWCYGDDVTLEYDGEAKGVEWTIVSSDGKVLCSEDGKILNMDMSGHDELKVTQKVTTDQGSSVKNVTVRLLHLNGLSVNVRFFDGEAFYDQRTIDSTTVCKNRTFIDLPDDPTGDSGRFGGWIREDGTPFAPDTPIVESIDVYAKWLRPCSVILMSDGEIYSNLTAYEGDRISLSAPVSTDGRQFTGWSLDKNVYSGFNQEEPITEDLVLYAVWSEEDNSPAHTDTLSLLVIVPLLAILAIYLYSHLHRNKVRISPGSSKGRFGGR